MTTCNPSDVRAEHVHLSARILSGSALALSLVLTACGGGGGGGGGSSATSGSSSYQVGGTLTGLSSGTSVTLKNGSASLTLAGNGAFSFPTQEASGSTYDVTVGTEPALPEHCSVSQGSGTVNGANVTSVNVACTQTITETVLYRFIGSPTDGSAPFSGLIEDASGDLFGTTSYGGGSSNCTGGCGTVFELKPTASGGYAEAILYSFGANATDGMHPFAGLVADASGNLFGTTNAGGSSNCTGGCGTVFELKPTGSGGYAEAVLWRFAGPGADGDDPYGDLIMDRSGDLFGTTELGGASSEGIVFELIPNGNNYVETALYSFGSNGANDAAYPYAGLIEDSSGDLFGTTEYGGSGGHGAVFELTPGSLGYQESVLYSFKGGTTDGSAPYAGLIEDSLGNLFGTTSAGGSSASGTVFELKPNGSGPYTETVLHNFTGGTAGDGVPYAGLIEDSSGDLFGTTNGGLAGNGTVFELTPGGTGYTETVLHSFANNGVDGRSPYYGSLLQDASGDLFGTTWLGGSTSSNAGTVFEIQ